MSFTSSTPRPSSASSAAPTAADILASRRSVSAMRLEAPGPDAEQLLQMLGIAARVPDHGGLVPWRFIVVEQPAGQALAEKLGEACLRSADGTESGQEGARRTVGKLANLFGRPPLVVVVVGCPNRTASIPLEEQVLSAGAVCMNLMNAATALGFGANWLTGWTASSPAGRAVLGLGEGETIAGVIPIGTAAETPPDRPRPGLAGIVQRWTA